MPNDIQTMRNRNIQNWIVGIFSVYKIFAERYIPLNFKEMCITISTILGLILLLSSIYYLFIDRKSKKIKPLVELTSGNNFGNYFQVWLLLLINRIDIFNPIGTLIYLIISLSFLVFCLGIVVITYLKSKDIISLIIIGHLFFAYCLFSWSKSTFIRHFGNEIIGSFWEKPNYKANYLIKIYKSDETDKYYSLPGLVHVFSEISESDFPDEDRFGQEYYETFTEKYILLEKVFFNDGGFLIFEECNLEIGRKKLCSDQNNEYWYIELTNRKLD